MSKPISPLPPPPKDHPVKAPQGSCDTHVHLLAAPHESPLFDGRTEDPAQPYADYLSTYKSHLAALGIKRGVIVQSIFYGLDNTVTVRAVQDMGKGFKGIGLLPDGASAADLDQFVAWNLSGVRLNYVHGGVLTWDGAKSMAPMLADRGLHIQMLMHVDKHMDDLAHDIRQLPVPVVFDHIGWPSALEGATKTIGFTALCRAMERGQVYVKLSGLYRMCDAPYEETDAIVRALVAANPRRCLWGSDWPHIMLNGAEMPPPNALWEAFLRAVPDEETRKTILVDAPAELYQFDRT